MLFAGYEPPICYPFDIDVSRLEVRVSTWTGDLAIIRRHAGAGFAAGAGMDAAVGVFGSPFSRILNQVM